MRILTSNALLSCGPWLLAILVSPPLLAKNISYQKVFGPEIPGRYKHPAALEELPNGDLYLVYYGGEGEYETDTAVYGSRRRAGETEWETPHVIADTPHRSEGNAVIWQAPDGRVWLFYVCRYGDTWSTSRIKAKISDDLGKTWSDSVLLTLTEGTMVRNQPIVLHDGKYLLPIYYEHGEDTEFTTAETASGFLRYDPESHVWEELGKITSGEGNLQPGVVEVAPDHLLAYCRRAGGYGPESRGWIVRSESRDGGQTWSPGQFTEFRNPNAAIEFLRWRDDALLLIYNDHMHQRTPLAAALSTDGGKTFPQNVNLVEGPGPYAYPYAIAGSDGKIHLVFTSEGRTVINYATFDESVFSKDK